ncbi:FAD-binding domain-containing protein [Xylariaceae sp. AK1471]|nr:FAD-binding domain-containing protein [Xylariaceae sp. AK1471]
MTSHQAAVKQIAQSVKTFYSRRESFRIFHGSTNSTRPCHREPTVDISCLSNIIEIEQASRSVLVEPNVPMDRLIADTLKHGLIPPVVMEFPGITVGGGYSGSAGESSSFRYGYFDEAVNSVEMILGNGEVVRASREDHPELFKGAAGALGTLGITTLLELRLLPAKRFVHTLYHRTNSVKNTIDKLKAEIKNPKNDYVDGVMFSNTFGVVITGTQTDELPHGIVPRTFSRAWDPWYYLHVREKGSVTQESQPTSDYVPLPEYLFRWDRGGFWVGSNAFDYFGFVPFNQVSRWFLDDFMHTRVLYRALHGSNESFGFMVQDLSLPYSTAESFIDYTARELSIWPLWLCPLKEIKEPTFHPSTKLPGPGDSPKPMLNVGLWGRASKDRSTFLKQNRRLEQVLGDLGGRKVLYAHTYYTQAEFWKLYDKQWYDDLRKRYWAESLPTIYDKVKVDMKKQEQNLTWGGWLKSFWPIPGVLGVIAAIQSKDYLLHKNKPWKGI